MQSDSSQELLEELVRIRTILEFLAEEKVKATLSEAIRSESRRRLWSLMDGSRNTAELAGSTAVDIRSVQRFVSDLVDFGLVDTRKRSHPRRRFDIIPKEWKLGNE